MNLLIRQATPEDLAQVLALYAQPGLDDGETLDLAKAQQILAEFARYPNYRLFVACPSDQPLRVVGSYALLVMHNLAHMGTPSAIA